MTLFFVLGLEENCWFSVHPVSQQRSEGEKVSVCAFLYVYACMCIEFSVYMFAQRYRGGLCVLSTCSP